MARHSFIHSFRNIDSITYSSNGLSYLAAVEPKHRSTTAIIVAPNFPPPCTDSLANKGHPLAKTTTERGQAMGTAAGTVARQIVSRAVASAAAATSSRPVASLASCSASSPFRSLAAVANEPRQSYHPRSKVTSAPPPGPDSSLLEPTWRKFLTFGASSRARGLREP